MIRNFNAKLRFGTDVANGFAYANFDKLSRDFVILIRKLFRSEALAKAPQMKYPIAQAVIGVIEKQHVIANMLTEGYSMGEFGLVIGQVHAFLQELTQYLTNKVTIVPRSGPFSSDKINVVTDLFIPVDYDEVGELPNASYISAKSGERIEWAKWLLTRGTSKIIENYRITYNPEIVEKGQSRSGQAIMVKAAKSGKKSKDNGEGVIEGGGWYWSVPSEFAGTTTDNFLTKAILSASLSGSLLSGIVRSFYQDVFNSIFS